MENPIITHSILRKAQSNVFGEGIFVPNSLLPPSYHAKRGGRTVSRLEKMVNRKQGLTSHKIEKAVKARNVAKLRAQADSGIEEFDYSQNETNDTQLTKNQIAMVNAMIAAGHMDTDDIHG